MAGCDEGAGKTEMQVMLEKMIAFQNKSRDVFEKLENDHSFLGFVFKEAKEKLEKEQIKPLYLPFAVEGKQLPDVNTPDCRMCALEIERRLAEGPDSPRKEVKRCQDCGAIKEVVEEKPSAEYVKYMEELKKASESKAAESKAALQASEPKEGTEELDIGKLEEIHFPLDLCMMHIIPELKRLGKENRKKRMEMSGESEESTTEKVSPTTEKAKKSNEKNRDVTKEKENVFKASKETVRENICKRFSTLDLRNPISRVSKQIVENLKSGGMTSERENDEELIQRVSNILKEEIVFKDRSNDN